MLGNLPQAKQTWFNRGISLTIWPIGKVLKSSTRVYHLPLSSLLFNEDASSPLTPKWPDCARTVSILGCD